MSRTNSDLITTIIKLVYNENTVKKITQKNSTENLNSIVDRCLLILMNAKGQRLKFILERLKSSNLFTTNGKSLKLGTMVEHFQDIIPVDMKRHII